MTTHMFHSREQIQRPLCGSLAPGDMFSGGEHLVDCPDCRRLQGWPTREPQEPPLARMAREHREAMVLLKHIYGYMFLHWATDGRIKDRIEALLGDEVPR